MYKKLIIFIVIIIAIVLYIFAIANPIEYNADPQYGDNIVLMNGHSDQDQAALTNQPSYIKVYDENGSEKASYKLEDHWDYINYNENKELVLYNETTKMCGIFKPSSQDEIVPYSCEDNYSNNIDNITKDKNESSLYIQKDGAVLYYDKEPYFVELYNEINTTYLIVDFVEFQQGTVVD